MVFITGDVHGDVTRFSSKTFSEQKEMTKQDYCIILGDFGLVWDYRGENKREKYWLDWLDSKPFTTLFIDGNHECYDRLDAYPVEMWHGGKVSFIRPSVIHLKRGQIFEIENHTFFTFGGASSHDIKDGILDLEEDKMLIHKWKRDHSKLFRVNHRSWWKQELPSELEMQEGLENLEKNHWKVDYILTHSPSACVIDQYGDGMYEQDVLTRYLEDIRCRTDYMKMYSGHMHIDRKLSERDFLVYEQMVRAL